MMVKLMMMLLNLEVSQRVKPSNLRANPKRALPKQAVKPRTTLPVNLRRTTHLKLQSNPKMRKLLMTVLNQAAKQMGLPEKENLLR